MSPLPRICSLFAMAVLLSANMRAAHAAEPSAQEKQDTGSARIEFLNSGKVLPTALPFSEAVRVDRMLYLSGMIGVTPGTMKVVPGGIREEARQSLDNVRTTLESHGYSLRDVIKCTVMLADIGEWRAFNEVYAKFFTAPYPARSAFGTSGLALGARVELECVATK
jgi:2-iminobutanoate/2-iminopropanoate deaminase